MQKNESEDGLEKIADFLFEAGMLAKTPRSGFYFLGSGQQSVAEHTNRVCYVGYVLAQMAGDADEAEILKMCLFHDLAEARVSDLNYVHQKYTSRHEHKAIEDLAAGLPFGEKIKNIIEVYEDRKSREALLAKDADNIEFILALKEQCDIGNERAQSWISAAIKRLKTPEGERLARKIIETDSDRWWFGDKDDQWWVSRNK
jgi:putative hydrolase of HD superfamily